METQILTNSCQMFSLLFFSGPHISSPGTDLAVPSSPSPGTLWYSRLLQPRSGASFIERRLCVFVFYFHRSNIHVLFDSHRGQGLKIKCGLTCVNVRGHLTCLTHHKQWIQTKHCSRTSVLLSSCNCNNSNFHFTLLSSPLGGPSVSAVKRSVSRPLPPAAGSRLGRRRGQQSQLWHGHRSVCPPVGGGASRQPGGTSHSHVSFVFCLPRAPYQARPEDSSSRATWWLWWQAGFQGRVTPTSWGRSTSRKKTKKKNPTVKTCWSAKVLYIVQ